MYNIKECPNGLIRLLCDWVYSSSVRPLVETSYVVALATLAAICGRNFNIYGTGLNLYLIILAETGAGKDTVHSCISKLFATLADHDSDVYNFLAQGEITSGNALLQRLDKGIPSVLSVTGEIGLRMQQICHPKADRWSMNHRRVLLDLYSKSGHGNIIPETYAAGKKQIIRQAIHSPALTVVGESTPETFFASQGLHTIIQGLLPRFSVFWCENKRPKINKEHHKHARNIPPLILKQLQHLVDQSFNLNRRNRVIDIELSKEASALLDKFDEYCDSEINNTKSSLTRHQWNRAHLKALRISGLLAVAQDPLTKMPPVVAEEHADWAINLVSYETTKVLQMFASNNIEGDEVSRRIDTVCKLVTTYYNMTDEQAKNEGIHPILKKHNIIPLWWLRGRSFTRRSFIGYNTNQYRNTKFAETIDALLECEFFSKYYSEFMVKKLIINEPEETKDFRTSQGYKIENINARPETYSQVYLPSTAPRW